MSDPENTTDFDNFPQGHLAFRYTRRELLELLRAELTVSEEEAQGIPGYKLSELGAAPDEYLAQIVPAIAPECQITVSEGWVRGQMPAFAGPRRLFPVAWATNTAFNLFNGQNDLGSIGVQLARDMDWAEPQAFAFARGLFLRLVQLRVCRPR